MNRFAQIFRIGNCAIAVVGLIAAALIAAGTGLTDHWPQVLVASGVVFAFVAAGNSLNDYLDREVDRFAHPERPIPSGRMRAVTALRLSAGAFVISFLLSLLLDFWSILIVASAIAIMLAYELYTKKRGLSGNLSIAWLTAALFLLGGTVVGAVDRTLAIAAMAFLAILGREIVKDIEDMKADFNRVTLP
ncbi:MAG TPA: UbiA family prenyltransferase, partial [Methanomassiliicoccales archaeon]|nr:UbiA family prenyltransferase [Methanomassiliicoccales archaeon]